MPIAGAEARGLRPNFGTQGESGRVMRSRDRHAGKTGW
jgi:hypothetical protein